MTVKPIRIVFALFSLSGLALLQPAAFADVQVELTLVAPESSTTYPYGNNNSAGGVYLSPYYFSVYNGTTTTIQALICDDYSDEITNGESWQAKVLTGAEIPPSTGLTGTTFQYEEIGYLANLLFQLPATGTQITDTTNQAALSFAIWDILDPTDVGAAVGSALGAPSGNAYINYGNYLTDAQSNANLSDLNGLTVYQPVPGTQSGGAGTPQQFIGFSMPEAPSPAILVFNLLVFFAAVFLVSRRALRKSAAVS